LKIDALARRSAPTIIQNLPLIVFGGFTLIGCVFIAVSKLSGLNPFISMMFPIILMLGYLGLSWYSGRIRLHDEQTGDNLYYMGFLFTLSSLGVSLYQFTSDGSMDDVVRNFGIAITSTIVGISLRILYNQTRRDVLDIERATRHDLASMTRRVRAELENTSREFVDFRRVNTQMITEGFDDMLQHMEQTNTQVTETVGKMAEEAIRPMKEASVKFGSVADTAFEQIVSKLTGIVQNIENAAKKIDDVMLPEAVIRNEFAPMVKELSTSMHAYIAKNEASMTAQNARFDAVMSGLEKVTDTMSKSILLMEKAVVASAKVQQNTDSMARKLEQQNNDMVSALSRALDDAMKAQGAEEPSAIGTTVNGTRKSVPVVPLTPTAPTPPPHVMANEPTPIVEPWSPRPTDGQAPNIEGNGKKWWPLG
jgi:exonuclease VII small subunit